MDHLLPVIVTVTFTLCYCLAVGSEIGQGNHFDTYVTGGNVCIQLNTLLLGDSYSMYSIPLQYKIDIS